MKMELIAALLHRPRVLFLDEPTIGLDVVSQRTVRQFLADYNRRHKVTILLTSHYMADIKELCERVIVIHKGRKIHDGAIDTLNAAEGRQRIIRFRPDAGRWPKGWQPSVGRIEADPEEGALRIHTPSEAVVSVLQEILAAAPVEDITIQEVPLEDIIADLFSRT
jgi:ABC-2 type transport system ATP-binding protein